MKKFGYDCCIGWKKKLLSVAQTLNTCWYFSTPVFSRLAPGEGTSIVYFQPSLSSDLQTCSANFEICVISRTVGRFRWIFAIILIFVQIDRRQKFMQIFNVALIFHSVYYLYYYFNFYSTEYAECFDDTRKVQNRNFLTNKNSFVRLTLKKVCFIEHRYVHCVFTQCESWSWKFRIYEYLCFFDV